MAMGKDQVYWATVEEHPFKIKKYFQDFKERARVGYPLTIHVFTINTIHFNNLESEFILFKKKKKKKKKKTRKHLDLDQLASGEAI